jgi:hypothetical protein
MGYACPGFQSITPRCQRPHREPLPPVEVRLLESGESSPI